MQLFTKIFNKILAEQTEQNIKKIMHHDQVWFILGCREVSPYANELM